MASIFANVLRTQTRLALVASKATVLSSASSFAYVSRRSIVARSLSTSQVIRADSDYRTDSDYSEVARSPSEPHETLYLGNLPFSIGEHELTELLAGFGEIKAVRMG
jgi:RNA recognition motif. (a.k.a. RRM, RBD, or RNP domain)